MDLATSKKKVKSDLYQILVIPLIFLLHDVARSMKLDESDWPVYYPLRASSTAIYATFTPPPPVSIPLEQIASRPASANERTLPSLANGAGIRV
jgi:hypothetical protein